MKQYLELLEEIMENGEMFPPARPGLTHTRGIFGAKMVFDMRDGFPIFTTKRMHWKAIVPELLWFLRGDTNIKYLVDNGCNIWNKDAYRWYKKVLEDRAVLSFEDFVLSIKTGNTPTYEGRFLSDINYYTLGDMGKIYGYQWRHQNGVDQILHVIQSLISKPESRYHILDAWNLADMPQMGLPPCHLLYQFKPVDVIEFGRTVRYTDMIMYQRSCDTFLGVPFDISMCGLLLTIICKLTGREPRKITWIGGDTHIYIHHFKQVEEILQREPMKLPKLHIDYTFDRHTPLTELFNLKPEHFRLEGYQSHPAIKAELIVGD